MPNIHIIAEKEYVHPNYTISLSMIKLKGSFLFFITDQEEYDLGTITVALPPNELYGRAVSSPLNIIGMKNTLLSNLISKNISARLKAPIMLFLLIKNKKAKEQSFMQMIMNDIDDFLTSVENKLEK